MPDQATALREIIGSQPDISSPDLSTDCQIISVTSGKGGVGKTNVVVNLAIAIKQAGKRVAIFDADLGLANVDVLLGMLPTYHLGHVIEGIVPLKSIVQEGPLGIDVIPASSGIQELTEIGETRRSALLRQLNDMLHSYDYLLIDTGAGISNNVLRFLTASRRVIVVVAPEPTAIVDAYALIKVLLRRSQKQQILILVNSVVDRREAEEVFRQLAQVVSRFLSQTVELLGFIPRDDRVRDAVKRQQPLLISYPKALSSRCIVKIAETLLSKPFDGRSTQYAWQSMV